MRVTLAALDDSWLWMEPSPWSVLETTPQERNSQRRFRLLHHSTFMEKKMLDITESAKDALKKVVSDPKNARRAIRVIMQGFG